MFKTLTYTITLIVITAIILLVNLYTPTSRTHTYKPYSPPQKIRIPAQPNWQQVDADIIRSIKRAHQLAEEYTQNALAKWQDSLMVRVDEQFIPWYFGYITQTRLQMLYAWYATVGKLTTSDTSAGERICIKIQDTFSSQVLRPEISELEIKNIAQSTVNVFIKSLHEDLRKIRENYSISDTDWNKHIRNIASLTTKIETQRSVPLMLKAATAAGVFTTIKIAVPTITLITKTLTSHFASKTAVSMSSSLGKVSSIAGKSLGTYTAIGFLAWDIIDHYHTKHVNSPILRQTVNDYLTQLSTQIKQKIMCTITEIETDLVTTIETKLPNKKQ